jgi:hypothetical protein
MQDSGGTKKFLGKNFKNFAGGATIFDFTYYRLARMLEEMYAWDPSHPDVLVLNNILELYIDGDVDVYWSEGYPLAYPTKSKHVEVNFSEEMYDLGIYDDSLFEDEDLDWEDF